MTPLLLTVKRYRKFVERFVEYSMDLFNGERKACVYAMCPRYGCQMKLLKTWRPLNVDYIAWITTVVEVI